MTNAEHFAITHWWGLLMSTLNAAKKRLDKALERLQAAAESATERFRAETELGGRVGALQNEQERLTTALLKARTEYDALEHITDTVSLRLDATIGQLKQSLDS